MLCRHLAAVPCPALRYPLRTSFHYYHCHNRCIVPHIFDPAPATPTSSSSVKFAAPSPALLFCSIDNTFEWSRRHYRPTLLSTTQSLCSPVGSGSASGTPPGGVRRAGTPAMSQDGVEVPCSMCLTIGDVMIPVPEYAAHPERVVWAPPGVDHTVQYLQPTAAVDPAEGAMGPTGGLPSLNGGTVTEENMFFTLQDPLTRSYLRWIAQKEQLGQDMCLIGDPGPAMRWLVMLYSHLTRREIRVVYLNSDITESDLKQRREIRNGNLIYDDQSAVSAAVEGQLLVLEGLTRVERNVLPVINNLLENREMHLDNGSVLIHPARYDSLLQKLYESKLQQRGHQQQSASDGLRNVELIAEAKRELAQMGLVRVSERFRVIGITVPVPPYEGNPLDPPLRSRFQCLYVRTPMPVVAPSSSVVSALVARADGTSRNNHKRIKQVAELQEQHSDRFARVVQLRAAITAINDSTSDFQLSKPSKKKVTSTAPVHGRGRAQRTPMYYRGGMVEQLSEDDADTAAGVDNADSGVAAASSPLQALDNWALATIAQQLALFPDTPVGEVVIRGFPWPYYARQLTRSGAGGAATGYANVEEYHRRLAQYAEVLQHCRVYPPLLLAANLTGSNTHARRSSREDSGLNRLHGHQVHEPPAKRLRMSERLRTLVQGQDEPGDDEPRGAAAARAYVRSAQLVSAPSRVVSVPLPVQQIYNYILQYRNVTSTAVFSGVPVVVADAVVATAAHNAEHPGQPGTYLLKVFMGPRALCSRGSSDASGYVGWDVAEYLSTTAAPSTVFTTEHYHVLQAMLQVHASRQHICLLGPTGCGKTAMVRAFGRLLGYTLAPTMHLYADMTHKDLFQQRMTDPKTGNTTWQDSPLLRAAIYGELVVLDGMEKLPSGMLSSLQQIVVDQSAVLADGTMLKSAMEYNRLKERLTERDPITGVVVRKPTDEDMRERRIFPVHPCFRVVATARPPQPVSGGGGGAAGSRGGRDFFITQDLTTLFRMVAMPDAGEDALGPVLRQVAQTEARLLQAETWRKQEAPAATQQRIEVVVEQLIQLRNGLAELHSTDGKMPQLSLRQLRQLVRSAVRYPSRIEESVCNTLLLPLMTGVAATKVRHALETSGLVHSSTRTATGRGDTTSTEPTAEGEVLLVAPNDGVHAGGEASTSPSRLWSVNGEPVLQLSRVYTQAELALVPYVTGFHANRVHESILAWLAKQYAMGSNILLIGNQGVGKNKVVDAFLSRLGIPRHYIQLHRDTTVGSLTINPTVEAGKVVWEDSPLVKAVQRGHCLVVDEIDKAPVEVVQVLKGLIEDREMRLGDGRQICDPAMEPYTSSAAGTMQRIAIHPDFRIIVLANPPGFPFHGNDFFRECGDLFAAYVMSNPDAESQLCVLAAYAPTLPRPLLKRLVLVFLELQNAFTQGNLTYPFSLRELIAVVKHMSCYPQDGVYEALNNVFNFDARDENTLRVVRQVLANYLQPMIQQGGLQRLKPYKAGQPIALLPFKELVTLPMTTMATTATAADAGHFTTLVFLPAEVTLSEHRFLSRIMETEEERAASQGQGSRTSDTGAAAWHVTYPTEAFFPASPAADATLSTTEAFTEWASQSALPFVNSNTDTVVAMTSVAAVGGTDAATEAATLPLLSVLLLRRTSAKDGSSWKSEPSATAAALRLIVATVRLPPSSIEVRYLFADKAEELATLWPVGHARFVDVSSPYATELADAAECLSSLFTFTGLDMSTQALPWRTGCGEAGDAVGQQQHLRIWPPSLATWSHTMGGRTSLLPKRDGTGLDGERTPQGVVLLSSNKTGRTVLIDVLAGAASDLYMARMGLAKGATTSASNTACAATTTSLEPVLPLHLDRCLSAASTTSAAQASVRVLDVSARHGVICFAAASSATKECFFLLQGRVVRVSFPQPVVSLRFVGSRLATVEMEAPAAGDAREMSRRRAHRSTGVVKVSVAADGRAHATMLPLSPDTQRLELVDAPAIAAADDGPTAHLSASDRSSASHDVLVPADLKGSLWRVAAATASSSASTSPSADGTSDTYKDDPVGRNVVYARVEGTAESGLQLRYYKSKTGPTSASAVPLVPTVLVDDARHQLLHIHSDGRTVSAIDTQHATQRTFASVPEAAIQAASTSPSAAAAAATADLWSLDNHSGTVYVWKPASQQVSVADVNGERVRQRYSEWSSLLTGNAATVGDAATVEEDEVGVKDFKMKYSTPRKQPSGTLKHGEIDDKEHHGGNTWAGGTGGTDTAGLGGLVGPYRLDKGNPVHQVSPEEKRKVPKHLLEEARRMGRNALKERLQSIGMSEEEYEEYKGLQERVQPAVAQLRALLMGLKAAEGERVWMTGQTDGVWDDKKLVEGIVGEANVYKRRVDSKETSPFQQKYKKRLVFVLDVSASMYRFNSMDQRLTKLLETTIMIMEAFAGFEAKLDYAMIGHNGDSDNIPLVSFSSPPANQKERMIICQKMLAYAQYCWSGDNTVEAMRRSIELVTKEKGDSYFVFVISDANLRQYGITPRELAEIIQSKPEVKMFCIFIATLGAQASHLQQQLPAGHGYECMRTDVLPQVLRQIFTSANLF